MSLLQLSTFHPTSNFYFLIILLSKVSGCLRYSFFPFSLLFTSFKPNTLGPIMTSTTQYYHHQWHYAENTEKYWEILKNTEKCWKYWKYWKYYAIQSLSLRSREVIWWTVQKLKGLCGGTFSCGKLSKNVYFERWHVAVELDLLHWW